MLAPLLASILSLAAATTAAGPETHPAPNGMKLIVPDEQQALLHTPAPESDDSDGEDESEPAPDLDEQAAEMEQLRALEDVALDPAAQPDAKVLQAIRRMGVGNPLRHRLLDTFEEPALRGDVDEDGRPVELPPVTDLANFDVKLVKDQYDIPLEMQPLVAQYIQFFQGPGRRWFRAWMSRSTRYIPLMQPILEANGLPKDTVYLAMIESGFSPHAASWARAVGPWQFISGTGKMYGLKQDFWIDERRDPIKATKAAAHYLKNLYNELGHWYLAWAAYNTGSGRVTRVMRTKGTNDFWTLSDGKGLAKETKHYVPKLIAAALVAKNPKAFGFSEDEFNFQPVLEWDEVKVTAPTDLEVLARAAEVSVEQIQDLNPELKRWCTPPPVNKDGYTLRIPKGRATSFAENYAKIAPQERLTFKIHKVKRGETLSGIALAYHSAPEAILQINRLRNVRALRVNAELAIPIPSARAGKEGQADSMLERQVARARRAGFVPVRPEEEVPAGANQRSVATGPIKTEVIGGKTRITYGVQSGDSLWTISQRFNCSVDDLKRWNNLSRRARRLQVGTVLAVWPGETPAKVEDRGGTLIAQKADAKPQVAAEPGTKKTVHQLAAGETLWSVAQRYGVTVEDIKRWNGITNHRALRPGQELTLMTAP